MGRDEARTDVLSDVLRTVRVQAACYGRFELSAPWGVDVSASERALFHFVLSGECVLRSENGESIVLSSGDIVALPHGDAHAVLSALDVTPEPLSALVEGELCRARPVQVGGGGSTTTIVSGCFAFEDRGDNPLLNALPRKIHLKGAVESIPWLNSTLEFVASEALSARAGSETVISRLADVLFIHIVRGYLAQLPSNAPGWLAATREPVVGAALNLIHAEPDHDWTVAELAEKVGLSRSSFSGRFTEMVGEPPLSYLTQWRMHKAASLLRDGRAPLSEVARAVGYGTETGFSKAFKRSLGSSPGAYRRKTQSDRAPENPRNEDADLSSIEPS